MLNNLSSPHLTLLTFGLSGFLDSGFLGGEWSRHSQTKTERKALEQKQKEVLTQIKRLLASSETGQPHFTTGGFCLSASMKFRHSPLPSFIPPSNT